MAQRTFIAEVYEEEAKKLQNILRQKSDELACIPEGTKQKIIKEFHLSFFEEGCEAYITELYTHAKKIRKDNTKAEKLRNYKQILSETPHVISSEKKCE